MNARLRHEIVWAPSSVAALIAAIGLAGLLFRQPLLFASLGPSAYLLVHSPMQPAAKPYNVIVGHLIALSTTFVVTALTGAADEPSVFVTHELVFIRVVCSAVALGLAVAMELLLRPRIHRRRLQCFSLRLAVFHPLFKVRSASWLE